MRKESSTTSLQYSEARYLAMPASRSLRWPESFLRAAITIIWWAASTLVAISASLNCDRLVLGDRLAEGVPLLRVGDAQLEGAQGDPAAAGGDVDPADLDAVHHLVEALAGAPAEHPAGRDADVLQDQFGGVDALVAHLLDLAGHGQARAPPGWAPKPGSFSIRNVVMFRCGRVVALVGPAEHRDQVGGAAVGQPHLLAVDHVVVAVADRPWCVIAATSEPRPGSDMEKAPRTSPAAIRGRK